MSDDYVMDDEVGGERGPYGMPMFDPMDQCEPDTWTWPDAYDDDGDEEYFALCPYCEGDGCHECDGTGEY